MLQIPEHLIDLIHIALCQFPDADGNCVFTFTNTGKAPLVLTNVYSTCGCTVPSWPKDPIMPGKSNVIKVRYNTSRLGAIKRTITVESNATNNPIKLEIKGNVLMKPTETLPEKEESPLNNKQNEETKSYPKPY